MAGGCVVFAGVMAGGRAVAHAGLLVYAALVAGGAAWMAVMSTFNTATQTSVPPWVRARATAMHTLSALGSFAIGSAFWGALSGHRRPDARAAAWPPRCMAAGLLLARPFPLRMGGLRRGDAGARCRRTCSSPHEPDPEAGPVAVEIGYRIRAGRQPRPSSTR